MFWSRVRTGYIHGKASTHFISALRFVGPTVSEVMTRQEAAQDIDDVIRIQ